MNCPCGQRAVSFGPFGNACGLCEQALTQSTERVRLERHLTVMREIGARPHLRGFQVTGVDWATPPKKVVADTSLCACGARASRWYEGGQSCWFCVPRRTTQDEKVLAALVHAWTMNMDRVEAVARRQHRRWSVLNIARQTKDQYPVALRDWELWQVAKVQEDGRLKEVLEKSRRGLTAEERTTASTRLAVATLSMTPAQAEHLAELATKDLVAACLAAGVACPATQLSMNPAPYFEGPKEWEAAFYKALQSVTDLMRADADTCYRSGGTLVIGSYEYRRGRKPILILP